MGFALSNLYLEQGFTVYGISRNKPNISHKNFVFKSCDLSKTNEIKNSLNDFLLDINDFEIVFLNAGMLGKIKYSKDLEIEELHEVYNLNVYTNKELLDILLKTKTKNIIAISSGAAVNAYAGWASYCLSKSGLNMLIKLYAQEFKNTKLLAIAPGVIHTPMTDYIKNEVDETFFSSAKKIKYEYRQSPEEAAKRLDKCFKNTEDIKSGSFIDVRDFD